MKIKAMVMAIILTASQVSYGANWIDVGISSKSQKEKTYFDLDTFGVGYFNNKNFYLMAWIRNEYPKEQKLTNGQTYSAEVTLNYFDCVNRKSAISEQYRYSRQGNVIWSGKSYVSLYSSQNWDNVIPNSIGEALLNEACTSYYIMTKNQK